MLEGLHPAHRRPVIIGPEAARTAGDYQRSTDSLLLVVAAAAIIAALGIGALFAASTNSLAPLFVGVVMALLVPILWRNPSVSLYILVAGATLFETFRLNFPDSITDKVPFFKSLPSIGVALPLPLTGAELLMALALGIVITKRMMAREAPLRLGTLFGATALYAGLVLAGIVHGIGRGGDVTIALWEARAPLYFFFMYLIVFNLVQSQDQVKRLLWAFVIGVGVKGILGSLRFLVTLGGNLDSIHDFTIYNSILSHEESFFFALFFALLFLLFLFRVEQRLFKWGLVLAGPVLLAFLANERRAGMLALLLALLIIGVAAYALTKTRRRLLVTSCALGLIALPLYVAAAGNGTGPVALPARAVVSVFTPSERDQRSDQYRVAEVANVKYNIQQSPLLGQGYGLRMALPFKITDLSAHFAYWDVLPHNTVLWVWLRLGLIGFVAFWFMTGRTIVEGLLVAKGAAGNTFVQAISVFTIAALVAWIAQGVVDMGLADWRISMIMGALAAFVARFSMMQRRGSPTPSARGGFAG